MQRPLVRSFLVVFILSLGLAACGGGKSDSTPASAPSPRLAWDQGNWDQQNWQ